MANGSTSVDVSGKLDLGIGTRSPQPEPPPPPPPKFFVYGLGLFGLITAVISIVTSTRIITGAFSPEDLAEQVVFAVGTGVITVVAFSIGTRVPKDKSPPPPSDPK